MNIERALEIMEQTYKDIGVLSPSENLSEVERDEIDNRIRTLSEFLDGLTEYQQEFFAFKQTAGLSFIRRMMAVDLLLDPESPIRTQNG